MANIIEKQKVWRIQHRFDTAENWKRSNVHLKFGELAFDNYGNFKVGLETEQTWNELPYAGCTKFYTGENQPTVEQSEVVYVPGDMYKNSSNNVWYILTGYTESGEYEWEEISSRQDVDFIVQNFEEKLNAVQESVNEINDKLTTFSTREDLTNLQQSLEEDLQGKANVEDVEAVKEELNSKLSSQDLFDESGIIKSSLLPGSVDDIVEGVLTVDGKFIPLDSEAQVEVGGKLYVDVNTKQVYRWSGSQYVSISSGSSLVIGTTDGTAFEGSAGQKLTNRVSELERVVSHNTDSIEEHDTKIQELETSITEYDNKFNSIENRLSNQEIKVTQVIEAVESYSDRINSLEISDASQAKRLTVVEGKIIEQVESIASLETSSDYQKQKLEYLEEKIDNLLSVETPDGELTLGKLAFKNNVSDEDIKNVSVSKLIQNEDDDVMEFYCGDSSD